MATLALIDYGSGNLHSAKKALERAARESGADSEIVLTAEPRGVLEADRIVLPGVGAFADCRRGLDREAGLVEALEEAVRRRGTPFLGICVGMQLMATRGLEFEITRGLDWVKGDVRKISPSDPSLKIPHMGWNGLDLVRPHPVLKDIPLGAGGLDAYFVHSFALFPEDPAALIASTDYGGPLAAVVADGTAVGTQFHPEKSQELGLKLLANFLAWKP